MCLSNKRHMWWIFCPFYWILLDASYGDFSIVTSAFRILNQYPFYNFHHSSQKAIEKILKVFTHSIFMLEWHRLYVFSVLIIEKDENSISEELFCIQRGYSISFQQDIYLPSTCVSTSTSSSKRQGWTTKLR